MDGQAKVLVDEMNKMDIVDSHEHLLQEERIIAEKSDIFTRIYCHYSLTNAETAGLETRGYERQRIVGRVFRPARVLTFRLRPRAPSRPRPTS